MFENIENLKILSAIHKISKPNGKNTGRKTSAFLIRVQGVMQYDFSDKSLVAHKGEMVFIPKGCQYEYHKTSDEDAVCTIINMEGDFGDAAPTLYSISDFYDAEYMKNHFADLWKFGSQVQKYQCYALLYNLISYVSNIESQQYPDKRKFDIIEPAVDYLRRHIYDCDLKIDTLHQMCGVSHTYLRKIFTARFGMGPKDYVVSKRLSYAKSIIDSGEFETVKELALLVGYKDPLYFGKVFKKHYGASPVSINR